MYFSSLLRIIYLFRYFELRFENGHISTKHMKYLLCVVIQLQKKKKKMREMRNRKTDGQFRKIYLKSESVAFCLELHQYPLFSFFYMQ